MALEVEVVGWTEWDDQGPIPWRDAFHTVPEGESIRDVVDPSDIEGVWVYEHDDATGYTNYFWVWTYFQLDWDQWDQAIDSALDMYANAQA